MALVNKAWRESRFVPPGDEPGLVTGRDFEENTQRGAIAGIASSRFPFPNREHPEFKTYLNQPEHSVGVRVGGDLLFPDIVVMNISTTETEMLAEVETARSLRLPDVTQKWRSFCAAGSLYLYVPMSELELARAVLKPLDLRLSGLRAYRWILGQHKVEVVEIS